MPPLLLPVPYFLPHLQSYLPDNTFNVCFTETNLHFYIFFFKASLANLSTFSFTCAGTHRNLNRTSPIQYYCDWLKDFIQDMLVAVWKDLKLARNVDESEHITTLFNLELSTYLSATNTAIISTPNLSDVLLFIPVLFAGWWTNCRKHCVLKDFFLCCTGKPDVDLALHKAFFRSLSCRPKERDGKFEWDVLQNRNASKFSAINRHC